MTGIKQESKLKRNLKFSDLMAIAIGQIIGAGIMSTTGVAIGMTGTGVVLAFLLSPILTIISIFPTAILSSSLPTTGGPYKYTSRILGKVAGLIYLLLHITAYGVAISQYSLSFGIYFESVFSKISAHTAAIIVLTLFFILNLKGAKSAAILNKIITIGLFGGLALFIVYGLPQVDFSYVFDKNNLFSNGMGPFIATLALLSSATAGAQFIAELGGEAIEPEKNIPKVMILSTLGVGVVYVLIAIVASGILPIDQVANQPLTLVAKKTMPILAFTLFVVGAALGATSSTLNSTLSWITKPLLVACDDKLLPNKFGKVGKSGSPYLLLTFFYIAGMIPLVLGHDISQITKFTTANSLLCKIFVCVDLFVLTLRHKHILTNSSMNISVKFAKVLSLVAIVVLVVLSYSLLATLPTYVMMFLLVLTLLVIIYSKTIAKSIEIDDDLIKEN